MLETTSRPSAKSFPDNLPPGWRALLAPERHKEYFRKLTAFLQGEYKAKKRIYPPRELVLRALQTVDYPRVRVVILGQDPYHGEGQAIGMSFAVPNALQPKPPSLVNIFKEIQSDLGVSMAGRGSDLTGWSTQGVLLLNTVLTVRGSEPLSHRGQGWEIFTDRIIGALNEREEPVIFVLWGAAAQRKKELIANPRHLFFESVHPSPLSASRGFFGCRHFSKINQALTEKLKHPAIDWTRTTELSPA